MSSIAIHVVIVVFIATLIRSTFGFGEALVAVPLLALRLPVVVAAPLAVLISVLVASVIIVHDWRKIEVKSAAWLAGATMLGIPIGLFVLAQVNDHVVKLVLGMLIILFSIYSLVARSRLHLQKDHLAGLLGAGFIAGILGGAYGMNGPPLAVYGALRRWSPQHFRATLQAYFLPASLAGLIGYAMLGLWTSAVTRYFLMTLPGVLVAIAIGRQINRRLRGDAFVRFIYVGLIAIGSVLIAQAMHK